MGNRVIGTIEKWLAWAGISVSTVSREQVRQNEIDWKKYYDAIINEFDSCECEEFSIIDLECTPPIIQVKDLDQFRVRSGVDHYIGLFMFRKIR